MEQTIFSLSEYTARRRTDEEFISDLFWSHLFREPTDQETNYWLGYLQSLPPILTPQRKRMRTVTEFENLPDFEEVVNSIVDSNIPAEPTS